MSRLVLVLGDQLTPDIAALQAADRSRDLVVMAEVGDEATYVRHHPKKIAFIFAAMRKFARRLETDGWRVAYTRLDDPENTQSVFGEVARRAASEGAREVLATAAGEWRLRQLSDESPMKVRCFSDSRFMASEAEFSEWASGRKTLRLEHFYRAMRRKSGLLMEGDKPVGGRWNYDHDNRKPARDRDLFQTPPRKFEPDEIVRDVLDLVERCFPDNFGDLRPFWFATDQAQAQEALDDFISHRLETFGDFQDAMLAEDRFLSHSLLSLYLNTGLLDPLDTCHAVERAFQAGTVPINAAEGFIRQILGWREFVRGIYFREGPGYATRNALGHDRPLPDLYWGAETRMRCMSKAIEQTRAEAYAHHIQRLMVTGNFALLAGIDPAEVHNWYLAVYADAFEWVEAPNVIGMSQFADGGIFATKPYVSSGAYINRMSDYCRDCHYSVTTKTGEAACPFNLLYWAFLVRHRDRLAANPRVAQMYRTWDRMDQERQATILKDADGFLARMGAGDLV